MCTGERRYQTAKVAVDSILPGGIAPRAFLPRPPSQSCGNQRPSVRVIARSSLRKSHSPGAGACSYRSPTPQAPWAQRGRLIGFLWYAS